MSQVKFCFDKTSNSSCSCTVFKYYWLLFNNIGDNRCYSENNNSKNFAARLAVDQKIRLIIQKLQRIKDKERNTVELWTGLARHFQLRKMRGMSEQDSNNLRDERFRTDLGPSITKRPLLWYPLPLQVKEVSTHNMFRIRIWKFSLNTHN